MLLEIHFKTTLPDLQCRYRDLVKKFLFAMHETGADFTNCFRCLNTIELVGKSGAEDEKEKLVSALVSYCCSIEELAELSKPRFSYE